MFDCLMVHIGTGIGPLPFLVVAKYCTVLGCIVAMFKHPIDFCSRILRERHMIINHSKDSKAD